MSLLACLGPRRWGSRPGRTSCCKAARPGRTPPARTRRREPRRQAQATRGRAAARLHSHVLSQLLCLGRHTVTGLLCTAGRPQHDWSADYRLYTRGRVDPEALFSVVRRNVAARLPADAPFLVALDDTLERKRGRKIPGTAWRRDPLSPPFGVNWVWGRRILQLSALLPLNQPGWVRALPIDHVDAPTAVHPRRHAAPELWAAYRQQQRELNINRQALGRIERLRQQLYCERPGGRLWLVGDGRFTNRTLLRNLPAGVTFIGRVRHDAKLCQVPTAAAVGPRGGRPRVYGAALPTPEALRQDEARPWQVVRAFAAGREHAFRIKTLGPVRWRATGKQDLQLIVIAPLGYRLSQGGRRLYRQPAYLICTQPQAPLDQVLQAYLWRWDIEVNFRDQKTVLGVGQAQVRHPQAVQRVPAVAVAAYALLLLAGIEAFGPDGRPHAVPRPAWRRRERPHRATTGELINQLRWELWGQAIASGGLTQLKKPLPATQKCLKPAATPATAIFYSRTG